MHFLTDNEVRLGAAAATSATTAVNGAASDMANYDEFAVVAQIATANAGNYLTIQQADDSAFSTNAETLSGAKAIAGADGDLVAVSVYRPTRRYVRGVITRTAATVTGIMTYYKRGARTLPVDNNVDSEIVSAAVASPAAVS